jgi:chitinase
VNESPENDGTTGYPGTNFAGHCGGTYYSVNGQTSDLLDDCSAIAEDIPTCQALGVKIILSIGGVYSQQGSNYAVSTVQNGEDFATFLWYAFGPYDASWTGPRPFDSATVTNAVDGFDFDIEEKFSKCDLLPSGTATPVAVGIREE